MFRCMPCDWKYSPTTASLNWRNSRRWWICAAVRYFSGSVDGLSSSEDEEEADIPQNEAWMNEIGLSEFIVNPRTEDMRWILMAFVQIVFLSIFDYFETIMTRFITATNSFAAVKGIRKWVNLTLSEFQTFLAIVLHLGLIIYASRKEAWSSGSTGSKFLRQLMTRDRFDNVTFLNVGVISTMMHQQMKCWML